MATPLQETEPLDSAAAIRGRARELGFALCEVGPASSSPFKAAFMRWLAEGHHGEMAYVADHAEVRVDPAQLLPGAVSVICVADWYATQAIDAAEAKHSGRIARYAWGRDYHKVMRRRLFTLADAMRQSFPEGAFRVTVDTAPTFEREHAARAGLGFIGKHTLTIHPRLGSWLLLGCIFSTVRLHEDAPATAEPASHALATLGDRVPGCANCTRCIDACPTDCIRPYQLDADRCISYLTIEHRSTIAPGLHAAMGDWLAGCDICQDVCPYNRAMDRRMEGAESGPGLMTSATVPLDFRPRPELAAGLDPFEVVRWTEEDRLRAVGGTALTRIKLEPWKRNAMIVLTNRAMDAQDQAISREVEAVLIDMAEAPDGSDMLRQTARQCLARLRDS